MRYLGWRVEAVSLLKSCCLSPAVGTKCKAHHPPASFLLRQYLHLPLLRILLPVAAGDTERDSEGKILYIGVCVSLCLSENLHYRSILTIGDAVYLLPRAGPLLYNQ